MSEVEKSNLDIIPAINSKGKLVDRRGDAEKVKAWIVKALVIIFGSTISCSFVLVILAIIFPHGNVEDWKDIVTLILVAETGIVGTAIGFYIGEVSKF